MNVNRFGDLEVIVRVPAGEPRRRTPLVFVHGAYTAAWCWEEFFMPWFASQGYVCYALSLSGHGSSRKRHLLDLYGIDDYAADVAEVVEALETPPVLIGHSMGGMVVQKYLERASVPAAVLMASVPPQGLWASALNMLLSKPQLLGELNRLLSGTHPDVNSVRDALFHQAMSLNDLQRYASLAQPESNRAIWDMTFFNLPCLSAMHRPPLLVLGAEYDAIIPPVLVQRTAESYGVEAELFAEMGHGMMLEKDWQLVAQRIAGWLDALALE